MKEEGRKRGMEGGRKRRERRMKGGRVGSGRGK